MVVRCTLSCDKLSRRHNDDTINGYHVCIHLLCHHCACPGGNALSLTLKMLLKAGSLKWTDKSFRYRPHHLTRVLFHHHPHPPQLFPFPSAAHLVELLGPRVGQRQRQTGEQKQRREVVAQWNSFDKGKHISTCIHILVFESFNIHVEYIYSILNHELFAIY